MDFDPSCYGAEVAELLHLDGDGRRPFPFVLDQLPAPEVVSRIERLSSKTLFKGARAPQAALAGLWLYYGAFDQAHSVAQDLPSPEGSYWHAILHRHEPDAGNAGYWFRRVGNHPVFPELSRAAATLVEPDRDRAGFVASAQWDPFAFIEFYERARRQPADPADRELAAAIALAEWQLLFDYCARP